MKSKCDYLPYDVIIKALNKDPTALGIVISHYTAYVKAAVIDTGIKSGIDISALPVEDITQVVWIKFLKRRLSLFKILS